MKDVFLVVKCLGVFLGGIWYTVLGMPLCSVDFGSLWLTRIPFQGLSSRIHILRRSPADVCSRVVTQSFLQFQDMTVMNDNPLYVEVEKEIECRLHP